MLKPAGEARAEPNQNPQLPDPMRRGLFENAGPVSGNLGCCGGMCSGGGNMAA